MLHAWSGRAATGDVRVARGHQHGRNNTCKYPIYDINLVQTLLLSSKSPPAFQN
jgi:hypothetical protein